jgi:hypothetical protein
VLQIAQVDIIKMLLLKNVFLAPLTVNHAKTVQIVLYATITISYYLENVDQIVLMDMLKIMENVFHVKQRTVAHVLQTEKLVPNVLTHMF